MSERSEIPIPEFPLEQREAIAIRLHPRRIEEIDKWLEDIKAKLFSWRLIVTEFEARINARQPVIHEVEDPSSELGDISCDSTPAFVLETIVLADDELKPIYDALGASRQEMSRLLALMAKPDKDVIATKRAQEVKVLLKKHVFFHNVIQPLLKGHEHGVKKNEKGSFFHFLLRRDLNDIEPISVDSDFATVLSQVCIIDEESPNSQVIEFYDSETGWTDVAFFELPNKQIIIFNFRRVGNVIEKIGAIYSSIKCSPEDRAAFLAKNGETLADNSPLKPISTLVPISPNQKNTSWSDFVRKIPLLRWLFRI